jgi:hypothetical protein
MTDFPYDDTTKQNELIDQVEHWADRVTPTGQSVGVNRSAVYRQMVQAMRNVLQRAPESAVRQASGDGSAQSATNNDNYTAIEVPDDLLVFFNLRLASWERAVYETIDPRSDQHRLQYNKNTQADPYNPVIASIADPSAANGEQLHCYPQGEGPTIDRFAYLPETAPENVPSEIQDPMVLQTVGYTLISNKEQGVDLAFSVATQLLQQLRRGQKPMVRQAFEEVREQQE